MSDKTSISESNIISYVRHCMQTFDELEFSEVDSLVLSAFSYLRFPSFLESVSYPDGIPLRDLFCSEYFEQMFSNMYHPESYQDLFTAMAASPRFRNMKLSNYENILDNETHMQFGAITIALQSDLYYVSFRGTDTTFTGWKEDLKMSRNEPVPGQIEAFNYLTNLLCDNHNTIMIGGHSKGGNLAVFSSVCAVQVHPEYQSQIKAIYSHDGPGFPEVFNEYFAFQFIRDKIHKTLPQGSLVGLVLNQESDFNIIESTGKGGIEQHSPFTWIIEENHFRYLDQFTDQAILFRNAINKWNETLEDSDRDKMINTVFQLFDSAEVDDFTDFGSDYQHQLSLILKEFRSLDSEQRSFLLNHLFDLTQLGVKEVPGRILDKTDWISNILGSIQEKTEWVSSVPNIIHEKAKWVSSVSGLLHEKAENIPKIPNLIQGKTTEQEETIISDSNATGSDESSLSDSNSTGSDESALSDSNSTGSDVPE